MACGVKWVRPGTPSIVRSATIFVKDAAAADKTAPSPEHVLSLWLPGQDQTMDPGVAFQLPAGAPIGVRIHYKKTWRVEGKPLTDRSTVGLYFATNANAQELLAVPIESSSPPASGSDQTIRFSHTLAEDVQALALSPDKVPGNISLQVEAVKPDGSRVPMIRLNTRADWDRRYWFDKPLTLPRGTRVEVSANLQDPDLLSEAFTATPGAAPATARASSMRLTLNVIPARQKPTAP